MASFKINIADPKTGKCYKTEVKDQQASPFMGINIGENIDGSKIGIDGYEFSVTGGTDYCGFPMRHGILGVRKKITIYKGTGFKGALKGIKRRKTVCGHKINETIAAINLKVLKEGAKTLSDMFGKKEGDAEVKEEKKEAKEKKPKEEKKPQAKSEPKKEEKPKETEEKKPEAKPEVKKEEK
ncbi:MAG: 30S ribosomal protein S6e [Candidatus Woesearchaeota archaeon]